MARAAKTDQSQREVVSVLRQLGYKVVVTSRMGEGFPDLVVILNDGKVLLVEVKSGDGFSFTQDEVEFLVDMVNPAYRAVLDAEGAVRMIRSIDELSRE